MTDSMKFGPEWLRNLSGDNCNTGGGGGGGGSTNLSTPRYQLAEHRYGREEMLALFERNFKPPETLTSFSALYVEKTQPPLALIQTTEDETCMWNGGVGSISARGRGGSVDRGGRGRGRGGLYTSHYARGGVFDEPGDGLRMDSQPFPGRSRPFDRSQSERGWSERNGVPDSGEWNGSTSPRKELSRGPSGSALMESNWRRQRGGPEDDDTWRKWGRGSWREGVGMMDRDRADRNEGDVDDSRNTGGRWDQRGTHRASHDISHHPPPRTSRTWESNHHEIQDNLPEWATENPSESGGSFDATGAFHGGIYSDDDENGVIHAGGTHEGRTRRVSEGNTSNVAKSGSKPLSYGTSPGQSKLANAPNNATTKERQKSLHLSDDSNSVDNDRRSNSPGKGPTKPNTAPTPTLPSSSATPPKKESAPPTANEAKKERAQSNETSKKSPSKTQNNTKTEKEVKPDTTSPTSTRQLHVQQESQKPMNVPGTSTARQRPEDELDRMGEEADALVEKLMADEENHKSETASAPASIGNHPPSVTSVTGQEKWFYRDPQGEVQGPFLASEMAEWCKSGYFTVGLLVRRTCDERYATLGELMKMCGRVPFVPGPPIPPLKLPEQMIPPVANAVSTGMPANAIPKAGMDDNLLLLQYQQMQLLQNHQLLLRQMRARAIAKLSQSEQWATLSPVEQNQLILQYVVQDTELPELSMPTNRFVPHIPSPASNPVMQLFNQMQQAKTQADTHLPPNTHTTSPVHPGPLDPIQQFIQQMGGMQNLPGVQQPNMTPTPPPALTPTQDDNPIKSLLRQLNVNANGHPQASSLDSVWPQPPPQMTPQFNAQNWLAQVGPIPAVPPGQLPNSLWELHTTKEMKTEQQILDEQNLRLQEERKKDELRKQEELQRQTEEENEKRKQKEEQTRQAEEAKRKEDERKRKEEEKKRKEEEKRKQEEEQKKKEEKKRKEEEKKKEEKRKQEEETLRKKQDEEKKKREEQKKLEEKQKKEEERKKKLEEEQRRLEEEKLKKEGEARRQAEAEEQARRAEQMRREAEALRKLQERSKAPWAQAPRAPAAAPHASLAEIQRLEREKKAEEQRFQQLMQQQLAQQKALEAAQETNAADSSKRLQFKWAEKTTTSNKPLQVKSLAQIQQEEQERITKSDMLLHLLQTFQQQERERQEKAGQKEAASVLQTAGIWGTASQSLNWTNSTTSGSNQVWASNSNASGFWDEPVLKKRTVPAKPVTKPAPAAKPAASAAQQQQQQLQLQQQNNKAAKSKNKKEEELVKKLFEQNTAKPDDFTQWCTKALNGIQASVDIPTFVVFLRDIESPYEVKEYVRVYLGESKQSTEFAKQFLEKRSKWRSAQRPQAQADDLCKPAPAVNPNAAMDFQEVKGKSKKPKKGKMCKVDSRILGFSVTAAPDRINVGDRDYGEGV